MSSKIWKIQTYYLVHRIASWNDKPTFEHCAKNRIAPISGDSIETEQTVSIVYMDVHNSSLNIQYLSDAPEKQHNKTLKLELR